MNELVVLESLPNPTLVQNYRARSIHKVIQDLENKLNEIESRQRLEKSAKARKVQEESALRVRTVETSQVKPAQISQRPAIFGESAPPKSPAAMQPSSLEALTAKSLTRAGDAVLKPEAITEPQISQPKAESAQSVALAKEKTAVESKPALMMGTTLAQAGPPPKVSAQPSVAETRQKESRGSRQEESREQQQRGVKSGGRTNFYSWRVNH